MFVNVINLALVLGSRAGGERWAGGLLGFRERGSQERGPGHSSEESRRLRCPSPGKLYSIHTATKDRPLSKGATDAWKSGWQPMGCGSHRAPPVFVGEVLLGPIY